MQIETVNTVKIIDVVTVYNRRHPVVAHPFWIPYTHHVQSFVICRLGLVTLPTVSPSTHHQFGDYGFQ